MGSGFFNGQGRKRPGQLVHQLAADRVLCGKVARVDEVDPLPRRVQKLVIAQVRRDEGIAAGGDGRPLEVTAGAAAHRHPADQTARSGVANAVGAKGMADLAGKLLYRHRA